MRAGPKPEQAVWHFDGECAVMQADTRGPEAVDLLEVERGVLRVCFEKGERLVGEPLNLSGKSSVAGPEVGGRVVIQSLVD